MSFRGKYSTRFRRSGSRHVPSVIGDGGRPFKRHYPQEQVPISFRGGRGVYKDFFHRGVNDSDMQIKRGNGRGRRFYKRILGPNLRSPRSNYSRGGIVRHRGNRNIDMPRDFERGSKERFSTDKSESQNEWFEEENFLPSDEEGSYAVSLGSHREWFDVHEEQELFDDHDRLLSRELRPPLIIRRSFERDDFHGSSERSFVRRSRTPNLRPRSFERDDFCRSPESVYGRRSRSPNLGRRSLERDGSQGARQRSFSRRSRSPSLRPRSHKRDDSHGSQPRLLDRRSISPNLALNRFENAYGSFHERSLNRRSISPSLRPRSSDRMGFHTHSQRSFSRLSRSPDLRPRSRERKDFYSCSEAFSPRPRSPYFSPRRSERAEFESHHRDSFKRSQSPIERHEGSIGSEFGNNVPISRSGRGGEFVGESERTSKWVDSPVSRPGSVERRERFHGSERERSLEKLSRSSIERQIKIERKRKQMLEHQKRCHEKRSESSIERFLEDCKRSFETKLQSTSTFHPDSYYSGRNSSDSHHEEQAWRSLTPVEQHREFVGLDKIIIKRGRSFERSESPVEILKHRERTHKYMRRPTPPSDQHYARRGRDHFQSRIEESYSSEQYQRFKVRDNFKHNDGLFEREFNVTLERDLKQQHKDHNKFYEKISETSPVSHTERNVIKEFSSDTDKYVRSRLDLSPFSQSESYQQNVTGHNIEMSHISHQSSVKEHEYTIGADIDLKNRKELSPISQSESFEKREYSQGHDMPHFSGLSPVSQVGSLDKQQDDSEEHERYCNSRPDSSDSMQQFLKELENSCEHSKSPSEISLQSEHSFENTTLMTQKDNACTNITEKSNKCKLSGRNFSKQNRRTRSAQNIDTSSEFSRKPLQQGEPLFDAYHISTETRHKATQGTLPFTNERFENSNPSSPAHRGPENLHGHVSGNRVPTLQDVNMGYSAVSHHVSIQMVQNVNVAPGVANMPLLVPNTPLLRSPRLFAGSTNRTQFQQAPNTINKNPQFNRFSLQPNAFGARPNQNSGPEGVLKKMDQHFMGHNTPRLPASNLLSNQFQNKTNNTFHQMTTGSSHIPNDEQLNPNSSFDMDGQNPLFTRRNENVLWNKGQNSQELCGSMPFNQAHNHPDQSRSFNQGCNFQQIHQATKNTRNEFSAFSLNPLDQNRPIDINTSNTFFQSNITKAPYWSTALGTPSRQINIPVTHGKPSILPGVNVDNPFIDKRTKGPPPPAVQRTSLKEIITISDDEASGFVQSDITSCGEGPVSQVFPDHDLVQKYKDNPLPLEELGKVLKGFVIYFGVRNNSELEKDPFTVIQDSFTLSDRFGSLQVEEFETHYPASKQVCVLRWRGIMLTREEGLTPPEARHKASVFLINGLAHTSYTVQAKYSYYCGGKLPKFMMKVPEKVDAYKIVKRDEIINAVVETVKKLKAQGLSRGVDATSIRTVISFIDEFFKDETTHCELLFGGLGPMDYSLSDRQDIYNHVSNYPWLQGRTILGYGRGSFTAVSRIFSPQHLCSYLLSIGGDHVRYRLIPPQTSRINLLMPNAQYNPDIIRLPLNSEENTGQQSGSPAFSQFDSGIAVDGSTGQRGSFKRYRPRGGSRGGSKRGRW